MNQFVVAVEVWVPSADDATVLGLGSGYYGDLSDFQSASEGMCFRFGEGLPGNAWASGRPIVLTDLADGHFKRVEAAQRAKIVCAIALPVFSGQFLQAVVVLFCGAGEQVVGAIEVWHNAGHSDNELRLADGYYGVLERFEWVSRRLTMMRGRGLPGSAWEQGRPIVIDDLGHSSTFLRASHAAEAGITTGLAIPFELADSESDVRVLTLLSAKGTPIARRFEIWMPDADGSRLRFDSGHCCVGTDLAAEYAHTVIEKGHGPLGESWLTGRPLIAAVEPPQGNAKLVLPVIRGCALNAIVCLVL